jgi:hypothetical protein
MKNNILKLEMFEAVCKCGHVGRGKYIRVPFPIIAESRKEAAKIARDMPRVKHDHKDAILNVIKIDEERYFELRETNNRDPYLHCTCIQDQNAINLDDRLMDEDRSNHYTSRKEENKKSFYCNKQKIRNQKKYMTRYYDFEKISNYNTIEYNDIA